MNKDIVLAKNMFSPNEKDMNDAGIGICHMYKWKRICNAQISKGGYSAN